MMFPLMIISPIFIMLMWWAGCDSFNMGILCLLCFAPFYLPVLYLHFSYYSRNSGIIYTITENGISKNENETETFYNINDFDFIEFIMTKRRRFNLGGKGFLFDVYYHAQVHLKNSEYFIITSLYPQNVEKVLSDTFKDDVTVKYTDAFYPKIVDYKVY